MTTNIYTWWSSRRYGLGCHVPMMRLNLQLVGITLLWLVGLNVGWNCLESRCIVGSRDQWYFPSIFPLTVPRGALTAGKLPAALRWRHIGRDSVSNHLPHDCLLNRLFRRRSKKTSNLRVTGLLRGIHRGPMNSPHKWPATRKMFPFDDVIMR